MTDPIAIAAAKAASLPCWSGTVDPQPLTGGLTNLNFVVEDGDERFFVRIADDIPIHGIMRFNEQASSRAAHAAGVSPEVIHTQLGAMVIRFIDGETFDSTALRRATAAGRVLPLLRRVHNDIPKYFQGPMLAFWVFQAMRSYGIVLKDSRVTDALPRYLAINDELEAAIGPVRLVFGHNDLLPANFIDDGKRLWLIDWDYGGLNAPLFDLANLASNNRFSAAEEDRLLEDYFETPVDDSMRRKLQAMKCASLLREAMWSMVSEIHLAIDFDYVAYTAEYLGRFEQAYTAYRGD